MIRERRKITGRVKERSDTARERKIRERERYFDQHTSKSDKVTAIAHTAIQLQLDSGK